MLNFRKITALLIVVFTFVFSITASAQSVVYLFDNPGETGYVVSNATAIVESGALKLTIGDANTSWKARLKLTVNKDIFAKPVMKIRYKVGTIQASNAGMAVTLKIDERWTKNGDLGTWRLYPVINQTTAEWQELIVDLQPLITSWERTVSTSHGNIQEIEISIGTSAPFTGKELYIDNIKLGATLGVENVELNPNAPNELLANTGFPITGTPTISNFSVTKDGLPLAIDNVFIRDESSLVIKLALPIDYPWDPLKQPVIKISYNGNDAIIDASNSTLEAFQKDLSYESYSVSIWKYWGKYVKTPWSSVTSAPWVNTDGVVDGWDWSLPTFVKAPQKSNFSLVRNFGLGTTGLNGLTPLKFVCKPTVQHWVHWKDLEPTKDNFTFTQLISNIQLCNSKGYASIVRILSSATTFAPAWVNTEIGAPILPKVAGADVQNYDIKDPRFHARYLKLVEEIGKSGIPQMTEVVGLYVGYASKSMGDEGIGKDTEQHVIERLDAWANITTGVRGKVFMGGISNYGLAKGFGIRRGFVEMYLYQIPSTEIGQLVDSNGYLYVDESNPIISANLFQGEENEEYEEKWATASSEFRYGISTASFPYRYFTSNLRLLQMRCNEVLYNGFSLMPEMSAWVGQELGCTIDEAPDVWSFLRESYIKPSGGLTVKNFERWLYQRDAPGYTTVPAVKINQPIQMWMVQSNKYYDFIAREGKKIGFNIEKNWTGVKDSLAFKVSVFDFNAGTLNLKYSNGNEVVTLSKPLLGDSLLKTYTFFVKDYKNGANIGGKFDFTLEAGVDTKSIVVSMVRVVQAKQGIVSTTRNIVTSEVNGTVSLSPAGGIYELGTLVTLTATPAAGYQFLNWTDANNAVFTTNPYTFKVTNDRQLKANFTALTALKDVKNDTDKSVSVYPNPVTDVLNIEHNHDATIRIYDMRGALLYNQKTSGRKTSIDVTKFKKSKILLLNVLSDNNSEFLKIIVQ